MVATNSSILSTVRKEAAVLLVLLLVGMVLLPILAYFVGNAVFGEYEGQGFGAFFGALQSDFRAGVPVVWFLMLSPYIGWQLLRLTIWGFRRPRTEERAPE